MRTIHKIGIGVLVGLFFVSGYGVRIYCAYQKRSLTLAREAGNARLSEGMRIASTRLADVADVDIQPLETLYSVLKNLREHYVEQLTIEDEGKMTYDAMRTMLANLNDPNTRFIEPAQRKLITDAEQGKFHGIGAILAIKQTWKPNKQKPKEPINEEHLIIATLLPGSPAAKAGLKPGDEIASINGKAVLPFNPYQQVNDMLTNNKIRNMDRGKLKKFIESEQKRIDNGINIIEAENLLESAGKDKIELTLAAKETKITITPEDLNIDPVSPVRIENGNLGYVRVNYFGPNTAAKFAEAMRDLEGKAAKGLIIDLRGSTGGNTQSAEKIASWFAPNKTLAILLKSHNRKVQIRTSNSEGKVWQKPLVLLVDNSTTRVPEVFAAGLHENNIAKLVGKKTYGEFIDTTLIDLADGSAVVMASGKYITSKGVDFNGKGLPVDVQAISSDQQLKEAIKLLSGAGGKS